MAAEVSDEDLLIEIRYRLGYSQADFHKKSERATALMNRMKDRTHWEEAAELVAQACNQQVAESGTESKPDLDMVKPTKRVVEHQEERRSS